MLGLLLLPLYGDLDISAMNGFKRLGKPLTTMLNRPDLHPRLGTLGKRMETPSSLSLY